MDKFSIKLDYDKTNPTVWIVNVYKNGFPFKKKILCKWFTSEEGAKAYINELKYKFNLK